MLFAEAGVVGLETVQAWDDDGFVVLPAFLSAAQVAPAVAGLGLLFPTAEEFHGGADDARKARFADEFGGIDDFPFASVELRELRRERTRVLGCSEGWYRNSRALDHESTAETVRAAAECERSVCPLDAGPDNICTWSARGTCLTSSRVQPATASPS